jgi:hypothetical protein
VTRRPPRYSVPKRATTRRWGHASLLRRKTL